MASVFKRRRGQGSKATESTVWYIEFSDHRAIVRRLKGFKDKAATEEAGRKIERLIASRLAGEAPDAALTRWIEICPADMRNKLGDWGVLSRSRVAAGRPLADHVADWRNALKAKGTGADRVRDSFARVSKTFKACGFIVWADLDAVKVDQQLADWQEDGTLAAQTRNHYAQLLKQFCQWMVDHGRALGSPLARLSVVEVKIDRRRQRRALKNAEFDRFVEATRSDLEVAYGLDGPSRATLYVTVRRTGLRWSEVRALRRAAFDLNHDEPQIYIPARDEKHPRGEPIPLKDDAAEMLRAYFIAHPGLPKEPAFRLSRRNVGAEMVQHDLARAGIVYCDAVGKVFDFHAIRGQLATDMARAGVAPQKTQIAMRHGTIDLTLRYYTHLSVEDQREALTHLPSMDIPSQHDMPKEDVDDERDARPNRHPNP